MSLNNLKPNRLNKTDAHNSPACVYTVFTLCLRMSYGVSRPAMILNACARTCRVSLIARDKGRLYFFSFPRSSPPPFSLLHPKILPTFVYYTQFESCLFCVIVVSSLQPAPRPLRRFQSGFPRRISGNGFFECPKTRTRARAPTTIIITTFPFLHEGVGRKRPNFIFKLSNSETFFVRSYTNEIPLVSTVQSIIFFFYRNFVFTIKSMFII